MTRLPLTGRPPGATTFNSIQRVFCKTHYRNHKVQGRRLISPLIQRVFCKTHDGQVNRFQSGVDRSPLIQRVFCKTHDKHYKHRQKGPTMPLIQRVFCKTHDALLCPCSSISSTVPLIQRVFCKTHDRKTICAVFPISSRHICERLPKTAFLLPPSPQL